MKGSSNVMLVADTTNHVIRAVDFGKNTTMLVAGRPQIRGNLDTDPMTPDTYMDGAALNESTFTVPYSVIPHHEDQRYALVADFGSHAIRVISLFSPRIVSTALRSVGNPTDLVTWGDSLAFCDGNNHSIWIYRNLSLSVLRNQEGSGEWPAANLQLLSGADSPLEGQYAEGASHEARFWQPLGITYNPVLDVLYVADFKNRVIREINPQTGFTTLRIGSQAKSADLKDNETDALGATLLGPNNLNYHQASNSVYFTDRNPGLYAGVLRVWNITSNSVKTVVGKSVRTVSDGLVSSAHVGASAVWDVIINEREKWLAWTESDTHAIRIVSSKDKVIPCLNGYYLDADAVAGLETFTASAACLPCTNPKPTGTNYIGSGTPYGDGTDCPWQCPDAPDYQPFTCPEQLSSVSTNGTFALGINGEPVIVCEAGLESFNDTNGITCRECSENFYCDGFSAYRESCMANSSSPPGILSETKIRKYQDEHVVLFHPPPFAEKVAWEKPREKPTTCGLLCTLTREICNNHFLVLPTPSGIL